MNWIIERNEAGQPVRLVSSPERDECKMYGFPVEPRPAQCKSCGYPAGWHKQGCQTRQVQPSGDA